SHGCVRVGRPFDLAYHLLEPQSVDPEGEFTSILNTGRERRVNLDAPVGVHIVYWSAWVTPLGRANYRGDPYGRDAALLSALREAGVELGGERS
ncbi:MAG: murein L,D-transpeptidase, partial [Jannaschia sp.]